MDKDVISITRKTTLKQKVNFDCLNCLHSFRTKKNLNLIKGYMKIKVLVVLECLSKTLRFWSSVNILNLAKYHVLFFQILKLGLKEQMGVKIILKNIL